MEDALRTELHGKVFIIRGLYAGSKLNFNSAGEVVGDVKTGYWSSDALLRIESISFKNQRTLQISGKRILTIFDRDTGQFRNSLTNQKVRIEIEVDPSWKDAASFEPLLAKIFTIDKGYLVSQAPPYWGCWLSGTTVRAAGHLGWKCSGDVKNSGDELVKTYHREGGRVSAPRALSAPDPEYTTVAKKAKLQGTTVLWAIITPSGEASDIRIAVPLGGGLDDKAVEAVRKWKFAPAVRDGQPVPVQINIEVNFRLY